MDESGDIDQLIGQLGAISAIPEQNDALEQQIKLASALRQGPNMPHGQMAGHVYVAPNALQDLAAVANNRMGNQMAQGSVNAMQQNAGTQQAARTAYMRLLAQQLRNQSQQNPSQSYAPTQGMDMTNATGNMA